jgi:hypothetical protein
MKNFLGFGGGGGGGGGGGVGGSVGSALLKLKILGGRLNCLYKSVEPYQTSTFVLFHTACKKVELC